MPELEEFLQAVALEDHARATAQPYAPGDQSLTINKSGDAWIELASGQFAAGRVTSAELPADIYRIAFHDTHGILFVRQPLITDKLLRFNDSKEAYVLDAISKFWESKARFQAKGQLFKRGVMLWGPAGSGKSSIIALLAEDVVKRGGVVIVAIAQSPQVISVALQTLRKIEKEKPVVVVLEDIDEVIGQWGERQLLSLLDGQDQVDNIVYLATTNFPERLGARLMARPSRFDEIVKVDMPTAEMRRTYYWSLLNADELSKIDLEKWVTDTEGLSLAALRELVVGTHCLDKNYDETLTRLRELGKQKQSKAEFSRAGTVGFVNEAFRLSSAPLD